MRRVAIWNDGLVPEELGGGTRGNNTFNFNFDIALLSEEVKEFYKALANDDIVEMVDAYCDARFVMDGIDFKFGCISYEYNDVNNFFMLREDLDKMDMIERYYRKHRYPMQEQIYYKFFNNDTDDMEQWAKTHLILDAAFNLVCEANEQKGTARDSNNKTIKGPKWVNPAESIKALLIANDIKVD